MDANNHIKREISLDPDLLERIEREAGLQGCSVDELINRLLRMGLTFFC